MSDDRLAVLIRMADQSPLSLDVLEFISRGLDDTALAILAGNVSTLPRYMKSKDTPYLSLSRMAPSMEIL